MFAHYKKQTALICVCVLFSASFGMIAPLFGTKIFYDEVLQDAGTVWYTRILFVVFISSAKARGDSRGGCGVVLGSVGIVDEHPMRSNKVNMIDRRNIGGSLAFFWERG